jgi:hypothetical protein
MNRFILGFGVGTLALASACSPSDLVHSDPPSSVVDPGAVTTATGALALYYGATNLFAAALGGSNAGDFVVTTGMMTDEFVSGGYGDFLLDARSNAQQFALGKETDNMQASVYASLQAARTAAFQARQALQRYGAPGSDALIGRMYSLEAYSIVYLAEYFCNGVPLSQTPLVGDPVPAAGSTNDEMYAIASALLDTAITLSADSANFLNLAKVGKGRVLLDQAKFADAAAAVAGVPQTFAYVAEFGNASIQFGGKAYGLQNSVSTEYSQQHFYSTGIFVPKDTEGTNGLVWSRDPRFAIASPAPRFAFPYSWSNKYPLQTTSIRVADGIEAQLIRAEADLQAGGTAWLGLLNDLRANCTTASGCAPVPNVTGGTTQLPPLADSLTPVARLREVMQERAYWMYATGHRQGDLRRMLRPPYKGAPYSLTSQQVYPNGPYVNGAAAAVNASVPVTTYGTDVVAIVPRTEQQYNQKFHGCFDLNP